MKKGFVHIYTGDGKGKTTAALGLALRALGYQQKVCIIQFMKRGSYGETKALKKFRGVIVKQYGSKRLLIKGKETPFDKKQNLHY